MFFFKSKKAERVEEPEEPEVVEDQQQTSSVPQSNLEEVDDQFNVDDLKKGRLEKKSTQTASTGGVNKR